MALDPLPGRGSEERLYPVPYVEYERSERRRAPRQPLVRRPCQPVPPNGGPIRMARHRTGGYPTSGGKLS